MSGFDPEELKDIKPGPISWMASHPVAANLIMLVLIVGGFFFLLRSTKEVFPDFDLDMITTTMQYPGASPEEVEQSIILPIENAIKDVDGIGDITSAAYEGYGHVIVEVKDTENIIRVAQDIKTAVDQITTFPVDAENLTVTINSHKREAMELALYGSVSETVLRTQAERLEDLLEQSPGIDSVDLTGVRDYEIHIEVPEENLRRYHLRLTDIATIISHTAIEVGGGSIDTSSGEVLIRMNERRDYAMDFKNIPIIKNETGNNVLLGDIATIKDTFKDTNQYATFNGKPAVLLSIYRVGNQTPISVSDAAKAVIEQQNATMPGDLKIAVIHDDSIVFKQRAELLIKNGLFGLVLVVMFLSLFLDIRLALWVSMGIPISYMGAFLILPGTDFTVNMISMFAFIIALGIVVDDAIVVGENIYYKREQGLSPLKAAVEGARDIAIPVFVSVLTNIIAFTPLLFVPGFTGKIFSIIPIVVISVFFISLLESLFILPAHLTFKPARTLKKGPLLSIINFQKAFTRKFEYFISHLYTPALNFCVSSRYIVTALFIAVLVIMAAYVASGRITLINFPQVESDFSYAQATLEVGAPDWEVERVEKTLLKSANDVIDKNGGDKLSFGIFSEIDQNVIRMRVFLTDPDIRPISTTAFTDLWRAATPPLPGLESLSFASDRGGPGGGANLTIQLSHHNKETLDKAAEYLASALHDYQETADIDDGSAQGKRQFDFSMTDLGYTLGLTPTDVGRQVRAGFYGAEALKQQRGRNEVRVMVMLPKEQRDSDFYFKNMMIKTPGGKDVLLRDVVKMKEGRAYTVINRENGRRITNVTANVIPRSKTSIIVSELQKTTLPKMQKLFPGLTYSFEGRQADLSDSMDSLKAGMLVNLLVMYAILAILFSSYFQPIMVMIAIPFSIIGAIIGHIIMGENLSIVSMFGIIALSGVVINDSLILIDLANRKRAEGVDAFHSVLTAATQRFRPIILTSLTTFVGIAPMMLETSRQAQFLIPMAISLGFGILFSTFLTLVLIPALYMIVEDVKYGTKRVLGLNVRKSRRISEH